MQQSAISSEQLEADDRSSPRWLSAIWARRYFVLLVVLPTLITGIYYAAFAADQYASEAHLLVRSSSSNGPSSGGLAQLLGGAGGRSGGGSIAELADFLESHDAVAMLQHRIGLVDRFRRPEADVLSRLFYAQPTLEELTKYFRRQVTVTIDAESGIATVRTLSFRPDDSYAILDALLTLGEQRVNALNLRVNESVLGAARRQVTDAERNGRQVERELARFRNVQSDIDPQGSGEAQTKLVTDLNQQLALARAQLGAVQSTIGSNNPQYQALASRVRSLSQQVGAQESRLVGGERSIASGLADYAELKVRQDFAAKRYEVAAGGLERAREEAMRQQLFVTRLVEPNMPQKATYPKGLKNTATVFLLLMIVYGIGWLLLAGVREHAG